MPSARLPRRTRHKSSPPPSADLPPPPPRNRAVSSRLFSDAAVVQTLYPHQCKLVAVVWSPSGTYLATAAQDGVVKMFYVLRERRGAVRANAIRTFRGHTADVLHMAFSRSDFLLTASMDRSVRLWHADTAVCLGRFAHPDMVTAVAFHPFDENYIVSGCCDGTARLWRPADHNCVSEIQVGSVVTSTCFSADGRSALVGTYDGHVLQLHVKSPQSETPLSTRRLQHSASAIANIDAAVGINGTARLDLANKVDIARRPRRKTPAPKVCGITVDAQTREMFAASSDGRLHVVRSQFDERSNVRFRVASSRRSSPVVTLGSSMSADGRFLLYDAIGPVLRLVDLQRGRKLDALAKQGKRREISVGLEILKVADHGTISCAAFATAGAVESAVPKSQHANSLQCFLLAVGGDDGSLTIIENSYGLE